MELFRLYAYAVEPQRTTQTEIVPQGGVIPINAEIQAVLDTNTREANFEERTVVDFQVDTTTRTNETRDMILDYSFGETPTAETAAQGLSNRCARAMDRRSSPCLFILAALRNGDHRQVTLWTFPRDQAFQFRSGRGGPSIEVLTDVFSQTSRLRKAALFEGRQLRNEFLTGRMLDFQANLSSRDVANFWIDRFLQCTLGIRGDTGTRLLAKTLRKAYDHCKEHQDQEQIYAAITAVRHAPQTRWSLRDFADSYLTGNAKESFLKAVPNTESLVSSFDFQREVFETTLQFRVFRLDTGVFVSSPFNEVGQSVTISGTVDKRLSCQGTIIEDKMRSRHA